MLNLTNDLILFVRDKWVIILINLIIIIGFRIIYIIKKKKKLDLFKEILNFIFIIYLLILLKIVTYQDVISYGNNFVLFKELTRYSFGSFLFLKNIIGNILLFVPFGFFITYYLKLEKKRIVLFLVFIISISIESIQLLIGRCFDVDDVLLNLIGGLVGYFIYHFLKRLINKISIIK